MYLALNVYLAEAVEKTESIDKVVKELKSLLNNCKLTKFRSIDSCTSFYSTFFVNSTPDNEEDLTFSDWYNIYIQLLSQPNFKANLIFYISLYHPTRYDFIFKALKFAIERESASVRDVVYYYSDVKAKLYQLQSAFGGVTDAAMKQSLSQETVQFSKAINGTLSDMISWVNRAQDKKLLERDDGDGIRKVVRPYPMGESAEEKINLKEKLELDENTLNETMTIVKDFYSYLLETDLSSYINEDVADAVSDLKDSAQYKALLAEDKVSSAAGKASRAVQTFDRTISGYIKRFKQYQKNRQIKEMLGESYHIMRELIRLTASVSVGLLNPIIGVIIYLVSWFITVKTNQRDTRKFIEMIEDELEILEEKIQIAERRGDDKGKIQLMRMRQKMKHQLDRLNRKAYPVTKGKPLQV